MLMFECLSLSHPFSRNKRDHARELILHGWRPSLTEQVRQSDLFSRQNKMMFFFQIKGTFITDADARSNGRVLV